MAPKAIIPKKTLKKPFQTKKNPNKTFRTKKNPKKTLDPQEKTLKKPWPAREKPEKNPSPVYGNTLPKQKKTLKKTWTGLKKPNKNPEGFFWVFHPGVFQNQAGPYQAPFSAKLVVECSRMATCGSVPQLGLRVFEADVDKSIP